MKNRSITDQTPAAKLNRGFGFTFLIIISSFSVFPIIYAIFGAFKSNMDFLTGKGGIIPTTWHPENFIKAWDTANFARYSFNSVFITLISIVGCLIMTSMAGYVFARGDFPGKRIIMVMFLATMFLATGAITIYPIYSIARTLGIHNSLWGLIVVYVFSINVANVFLFMGYVRGIPKDMDEAAKIDGCGFFAVYYKIILPMSAPILATIALLVFKITWNDYLMPMVFTLSNDKIKTLTVGVVSLKSSGGGAGAYDIMLAGTAISLIPMIIFYSFTSKFFVSGIVSGAIKG